MKTLSAIFKTKKKLTEAYSMITAYDKQLRTLKRENKALKKRLSYLEEFNQNDQKLLYCQSVKGIY